TVNNNNSAATVASNSSAVQPKNSAATAANNNYSAVLANKPQQTQSAVVTVSDVEHTLTGTTVQTVPVQDNVPVQDEQTAAQEDHMVAQETSTEVPVQRCE
ncbi:hypothetical protein A2U01_0071300, partial [Trifolium medium]|nr:hypothetical protein [Trifolium medium]